MADDFYATLLTGFTLLVCTQHDTTILVFRSLLSWMDTWSSGLWFIWQ